MRCWKKKGQSLWPSPMTTVRIKAPAKVNLTLNITGRRPDGYHLLHSLVVFTPRIADEIAVASAPDLSLSVDGPMAAGVPIDGTNIVVKAARLLAKLRNVTPAARIRLTKHLPNAAGIGGGSSDAAATIRALSELWNVPALTTDEAISLGADVPVCLAAPAPMIMEGIGEVLAPAPNLPSFWLVLANPGLSVATSSIFKALDLGNLSNGTPPPECMSVDAFLGWLISQTNDLFHPAAAQAPEIVDLLDHLQACHGCLAANMSGSGATVWGVFMDQDSAKAASAALNSAGFWSGFSLVSN